ncbi:MAG: transposase [Bdellovibrionota bacterium]
MKQKTLFKLSEYSSEFGGALAAKKRKVRRPLSSKNPIHIVLRADITQSGSLLKYRSSIEKYFMKFARDFDVRIYKKALVSNHIHFVALFGSRYSYTKFVRALTGTLAKNLKIKWHLRPWTRLLKWGRDLSTALKYVLQNHLEATRVIPYQKRRIRRVRTDLDSTSKASLLFG